MRINLNNINGLTEDQRKDWLNKATSISGNFIEVSHADFRLLKLKHQFQTIRPTATLAPVSAEEVERIKGLGDVVHKVAQPIARVLDRVLGTKVSGCGGCAQRRKKLNELLPL